MKPQTHLFLALWLLSLALADVLELYHLRHVENPTDTQTFLRCAMIVTNPVVLWFASVNLCSAIRKLLKP